jgi:hypothetical protein
MSFMGNSFNRYAVAAGSAILPYINKNQVMDGRLRAGGGAAFSHAAPVPAIFAWPGSLSAWHGRLMVWRI